MASVDELFEAIGSALDADPTLAKQVNGVVLFDFGTFQWTLYLKGPNIGAKKERAANPDASLTLSTVDFLAMARKEVTSQSLFMKGKLRLRGNMGLAMKLGKVLEAASGPAASAGAKPPAAKAPAAAPAPPPATPAALSADVGASKSSAVFDAIAAGVERDGKSIVAKVKAIFRFDITDAGVSGRTHTYVLDLKNGVGKLYRAGTAYTGAAPDVTITLSDDDFVALAQGKLNAQSAFLKGKLKIKGQMSQAMKLQSVMDAAKGAQPAKL